MNSHHDDEEEYVTQDDIAEVIIDDGAEGDHPMDEEEDLEGDEELMQADEEIVLEDTSIQAFTDHTQSVFSVALHPSAPLAVSGGEDDAAYLWDTSSGDLLMSLTGHEDSVVAVAFSSGGDMVATGGMDGKVRIWKQKDSWKNWEFLIQLDGVDEVVVSLVLHRPACPDR